MPRNPSFSSPKNILLSSLANKAFNKSRRNDFQLESELYDESRELRAKVAKDDDLKRSNTFLAELREKRRISEEKLKLEVLLLNYMFLEDDGKISFKENRAISNHFKKYKGKVSSSVLKSLEKMTFEKSLDSIRNYILNNSISHDVIQTSINTLWIISSSKKRYYDIIKRIESTLLVS